MKILVTGFDPFGGATINPALEAVKKLPDEINGATLIKLAIPTVFGKAADVTKDAITRHQPDIVVSIGQAGGRCTVTPERVAINLDDARIPDNEGNQPLAVPIQADGPAAYFTQLPVKAMVQAIKDAGFPAAVSNTAGTFVCNHIMYHVLYLIDKEFPALKGGFIHVPFIPEQVIDRPDQPSMSLTDITTCLETALAAIVAFDGKKDLPTIEGTTH